MSISNQPANQNLLLETSFKFLLHKIPTVTYFCQSANLPGMSLGEIPFNNPFSPIALSGNILKYNHLNLTFLVDADLKNWLEIRKWMLGIGFPNDYDQAKQFKTYQDTLTDATLTITTSKKNPFATVTYKDCFPTSLTDIDFKSNTIEPENILAAVSFAYTTYKVELHNQV